MPEECLLNLAEAPDDERQSVARSPWLVTPVGRKKFAATELSQSVDRVRGAHIVLISVFIAHTILGPLVETSKSFFGTSWCVYEDRGI